MVQHSTLVKKLFPKKKNTSKEIEYRYSIKANRVCSWKEPSKSLLSLTASFIRGGCSYLFMPSKEG